MKRSLPVRLASRFLWGLATLILGGILGMAILIQALVSDRDAAIGSALERRDVLHRLSPRG